MSEAMARPPDLSFPPDPFEHGTCSREGCTNPAVFEGGVCANHIEVKAAAAAATPPAGPWSAKDWAARKKQRRVAAASARRNRR